MVLLTSSSPSSSSSSSNCNKNNTIKIENTPNSDDKFSLYILKRVSLPTAHLVAKVVELVCACVSVCVLKENHSHSHHLPGPLQWNTAQLWELFSHGRNDQSQSLWLEWTQSLRPIKHQQRLFFKCSHKSKLLMVREAAIKWVVILEE